jgi:protein-S-isoprenylcysteine O-methyltransferase Ste14
MPHDPLFARRLILWVWAAWALYWLVSAIGNKATQRREPWSSRIAYILPLVVGGVLIAWRGVPWAGVLSLRLWPRSLALYWVGLAVLVAGLGFAVWARVQLGRNWSGAVTVKEGHELIRTGPYACVRHPIYTGLLTAVIGTVICAATVRAALGFLIIAVALVRKVRAEEVFMRETFPGRYEKYCEEVPALVPFVRPRRSGPRG